jgi:chromosome segregation protein
VFSEAYADVEREFADVFTVLFPGGEGRLRLTDPGDMLTTGIEVEAALDDTNLRRLISLFELLRARSQLIIITHQKPTMEVADALYGVTMQGDGITAVISQRMRGQQVEQLVTT